MGAVGFILLGRKDLPVISRVAGRIFGNGVRGVRRARKGVEDAVQEGEAAREAKGLQSLSRDMKDSAEQVRSFGRTIRDELRPPSLEKKQNLKFNAEQKQTGAGSSEVNQRERSDVRNKSSSKQELYTQKDSSDKSGADIVSSVFEENK